MAKTMLALFVLVAAGCVATAGEVKKVLVFSRCEGFNHKDAIAACCETLAAEAKKGRFAVDFSDDYASLKIENLLKYDALVLNNSTALKTKDNPHVAPSVCSFVRWGGGLCAIHAAADSFYNAPDCAHLIGGLFNGHPWGGGGTWAFKVEDRDHPLCAPFKKFADGRFKRGDEIYQQASPFYDRTKLRVLVSLDLSDPKTDGVSGKKRTDGDYAVSWIRAYGRGRVFYTSFAHDRRAWQAEDTRTHMLAGLDYVLGLLKADDSVPGRSAGAKRAEKSLDDCVSGVFGHPYTGVDGRVREARFDELGAALGRAQETGNAQNAMAEAKRVFASHMMPDMVRACAARVLLAADPKRLAEVLGDSAKPVRQAAFGRGLVIPASDFAAALNDASPELKRAIIARLVQEKATSCACAVAACAEDADEETAAAAAAALGTLGSAAEVPLLEKLLARGGVVGSAAGEALAAIPGIGEILFAQAGKNVALLGIAAKRAETKLIAGWEPFIRHADAKVRKTAWRSFGKMISEATFPQARNWYANVTADEAETAANVLWRVVKNRADRNAALTDLWLRTAAPGRPAVETLISRANALGAFDVWEKLAADPVHGPAAKKVYVALADKVLGSAGSFAVEPKREKWRATASRDEGAVQKAFDGNPETRWASGWNPKGQWFALDLGDALFVEEVTLDAEKSPNDTPKGADVYISQNGTDWEGPVSTCDDTTKKSTTFKIARGARHLKFVATGENPGYFWSIHEIFVKAGTDKALMEKIRGCAEAFRKEVK